MTPCTHAPTASCWLCAWERPYGAPFWEDARVRAGLGHAPPNAPRTQAGTVVVISAYARRYAGRGVLR